MTEPGDPRQSPNLETHKKDRVSNLDLQEDGDLFYVWRMRAFVLLDSCCVTVKCGTRNALPTPVKAMFRPQNDTSKKNIAPL